MFKLVLEKAEELEIKLLTSRCKRVPENIYFCFIDYAKAFDFVDDNKLWKILKEMGIPDHLTCLLRNLYAGQEASVTTDLCFWVQQLPQGIFVPWDPEAYVEGPRRNLPHYCPG